MKWFVILSKRCLRGEGSRASRAKRRVLCDAIIARLARFLINPRPTVSFFPKSKGRDLKSRPLANLLESSRSWLTRSPRKPRRSRYPGKPVVAKLPGK
jgi:hypothetical protein